MLSRKTRLQRTYIFTHDVDDDDDDLGVKRFQKEISIEGLRSISSELAGMRNEVDSILPTGVVRNDEVVRTIHRS